MKIWSVDTYAAFDGLTVSSTLENFTSEIPAMCVYPLAKLHRMANGLDEFKDVFKDFRSVTGLIAKGAIAAPLADYVIKLGPPWPLAAPIITALLELLVLVGTFEFWYASARKRQQKRMITLFGALVTFFFIYFFLSSQYTSKHPVSGEILVHGYELQADTRTAMQPGDDVYDLLEGSEYKPEKVWSSTSLALVRLGLLTAWLGLFSSLAGFIAVFVMTQRRRRIPSRANNDASIEAPPSPL